MHYIQFYFITAFSLISNVRLKIRQMADGWLATLVCLRTKKVYRITVVEIKAEKKVEILTAEMLIEEGGFHV